MRAIFHPFMDVKVGDILTITDERAHHLQVVRLRGNDILSVLNGNGVIAEAQVKTITKKLVELLILSCEKKTPEHGIALAIALPKKEAFEDIIKISTELGINEIFPLSSEYSQYDYAANDRLNRIIESALVQSNNPYLPKIHEQQTLRNFLKEHKSTIVFFNSIVEVTASCEPGLTPTILIGPEGGFSLVELQLIKARKELIEIHLPTPILRAPTAVASSVGYLLGKK